MPSLLLDCNFFPLSLCCLFSVVGASTFSPLLGFFGQDIAICLEMGHKGNEVRDGYFAWARNEWTESWGEDRNCLSGGERQREREKLACL